MGLLEHKQRGQGGLISSHRPIRCTTWGGGEPNQQQDRERKRMRARRRKVNPCSVNKDVCAHRSPAMHALTQLTQTGVPMCKSLKCWHAQAAILTLHNKTCQCWTEWLEWLCAFVFCLDLWFLDLKLLAFYLSLSCAQQSQTAVAKNSHLKTVCAWSRGNSSHHWAFILYSHRLVMLLTHISVCLSCLITPSV